MQNPSGIHPFHQIDEPSKSVKSDTTKDPTVQSEKEITTWKDFYK